MTENVPTPSFLRIVSRNLLRREMDSGLKSAGMTIKDYWMVGK